MSTLLPRLLAPALALLAGCAGSDPVGDEVRARFAAFERALRADDQQRLFDLVTSDSLPALDQLPPGGARSRAALSVDAVDARSASRYEIAVREADGGLGGTFVMVRERGSWRVDLAESAATTHGVRPGAPTIEPAGLGEAQIDGIRANHRARVQ
jgi:hypothetical protein